MKRVIFIISILIIFSVCVVAIWVHNRNSHEQNSHQNFSSFSTQIR